MLEKDAGKRLDAETVSKRLGAILGAASLPSRRPRALRLTAGAFACLALVAIAWYALTLAALPRYGTRIAFALDSHEEGRDHNVYVRLARMGNPTPDGEGRLVADEVPGQKNNLHLYRVEFHTGTSRKVTSLPARASDVVPPIRLTGRSWRYFVHGI